MKGDNFIAFIGGAIAGAAIALLFAPETGEQTRKKIKDTFDKEYQNLKDKMRVEDAEENVVESEVKINEDE